MSVVHLIDTITEWAQTNICDIVKLKVPPENTEATDVGYKYALVTPVAFPMYVPTSEKLPPNVCSPIPSLCVRFLAGQDNMAKNDCNIEVQFCFSAWDTGTHGDDIYLSNGDGTYRKLDAEARKKYFRRNGDGWRDVWNFVDTALRAIESTARIGDYTIDRSAPIKYGPLTEQDSIPDYYPLWFAWVSFTVTHSIRRSNQDINNLL
ncbi:MAG: hypothetical protein GX488_04640 [Clostridiales bacterium]|nr:hypothetical protein [Clostridiales bacterium]